jgi:hypothetical protein
VHCDSSEEVSRAKEILKSTGADDVATSGEKAVSTHGVDGNEVGITPESRVVNRPYGDSVDRDLDADPVASETNPIHRRN